MAQSITRYNAAKEGPVGTTPVLRGYHVVP